MQRLIRLVLFVTLPVSPSLASGQVHRAPGDFLKSWVEGPICLGEQQELTLGLPGGSPLQLLQHTRVVPGVDSFSQSEVSSGVEAWRDYYSVRPRGDAAGFLVTLNREGVLTEAGKLPDCVLNDAEWYEGELHFLMRPGKALATSTHLYRSQVTPSGTITPPALAALAPPGMVLERFAVTRDGLYGIGRMAGDDKWRLLSLRGLETRSPGWSDCGEVRIPPGGEWDITSRGNLLVLCSPSLRDIEYCAIPRPGQAAQWERRHLEQGPWADALHQAMDRMEAASGVPSRIIHQFSLSEPAQVEGVRMETVGQTPPRLRWRVANAATEVYGDWSHFSMEEYVPIGEPAQFVQYEIRPPIDDSPAGIRGVELILRESPRLPGAGGLHAAEGNVTLAKAQIDVGFSSPGNLTQAAPIPVPAVEMARALASGVAPGIPGKGSAAPSATASRSGPTRLADSDPREPIAGSRGAAHRDDKEVLSLAGDKSSGSGGASPETNPSASDGATSESGEQGRPDTHEAAQRASGHEPSAESAAERGNASQGTPRIGEPSTPSSSASGDGTGDSARSPSGSPIPQADSSVRTDGAGSGAEEVGSQALGRGGAGDARGDESGHASGQGPSAEGESPSGDPANGGTAEGPQAASGPEDKHSTGAGEAGQGKPSGEGSEAAADSGPAGPSSGDGHSGGPSSPSTASNGGREAGDGSSQVREAGEGDTVAVSYDPSGPAGKGTPYSTVEAQDWSGPSSSVYTSSPLANASRIAPLHPEESGQRRAKGGSPSWIGRIVADLLIPSFLALVLGLLAVTAFRELRGQTSRPPLLARPSLSPQAWEEQKRVETISANQLAAGSTPRAEPSSHAMRTPVFPVLPDREKGKVEWRVAEPLPRPMAPATAFYHQGSVYVVDPHGTICHARLRADGSLCPWGTRMGRLPSRLPKGSIAFVDPHIVCVSRDEVSVARIDGEELGEWKLAGRLEGVREVTAVAGLGNRLFLVGEGTKGNPFPAVRSVAIDCQGRLGETRSHPPLPLGVTDGTLVGGGNSLYWLGGTCQGKVSRKVFSAQLGAESMFEDWRQEPDLPWGQRHPTAESWGGALWVVLNKPIGEESVVFRGERGRTGSILAWQGTGRRLPELVHAASLPFAGGRFLLLGGWMKSVGSVPRTEVLGWEPG